VGFYRQEGNWPNHSTILINDARRQEYLSPGTRILPSSSPTPPASKDAWIREGRWDFTVMELFRDKTVVA
jgi:hypothetical protein